MKCFRCKRAPLVTKTLCQGCREKAKERIARVRAQKTRACSRCKKVKNIEEFYKHKIKGGASSMCLLCTKAYQAEWAKSGVGKARCRNATLKQKYGITLEDYDRMFLLQGGVCAICKKSSYPKHLSVDHCHKTDRVRGLLCTLCNIGLGAFIDNTRTLESAKQYLNNAG